MLVILSYIRHNGRPVGQTNCDQHVVQNTGCNGRYETLSLSITSQTSQNDVEIKMADANANYFKASLILIHVSKPKGVQEKEPIMSVRY